MDTSTEDQTVIIEERWRAWVQKARLREKATARKLKVVAGIVTGLLALGGAVYLGAAK